MQIINDTLGSVNTTQLFQTFGTKCQVWFNQTSAEAYCLPAQKVIENSYHWTSSVAVALPSSWLWVWNTTPEYAGESAGLVLQLIWLAMTAYLLHNCYKAISSNPSDLDPGSCKPRGT